MDGLVVDRVLTNECTSRAEVGDTVGIIHKGFLGATQIDGNPEG